jgi:hypothetical protein
VTDLESRLERLESIVDSQQETIDEQRATIRRQRERIAALEADQRTGATETDDGSALVDRRDALKTGGLLALLVGGVGTASADTQGQVGTASDPLQALYAEELNGPVTDGQPLDSLLGSGLTVQDGTLTTVTDVSELAVTSFDIADKELSDTFSLDVTVEETAGVRTDILTITLEVVGASGTTVYEESHSPGELDGESTTVTFGADGDTSALGPFDPNDYTATVTAEAVNATPATATASFRVPNPYAGGSGTEDDPFRIETWAHLDAVRHRKASAFVLGADLDESTPGYDDVASASANGGEGFQPIGRDADPGSSGFQGTPFTGSFDGDGHTVSGLTIDTDELGYVGLFGYLSAAAVTDLTLDAVEITGGKYVGSLAGTSDGGTIEGLSVTESVVSPTSTGGVNVNFVGGLVGTNTGQITEVSTDGEFTGSVRGDQSRVGGLVGENEGTISNASATGRVTVGLRNGGLVGQGLGTISDSTADVTVSSLGDDQFGYNYAGGLVGFKRGGTIERSHATGDTPTNSETRVAGGLVAYNIGATVQQSYATGSVTARDRSGGLVGYNNGTVRQSYATGTATATDSTLGIAGGLVARNYRGTVTDSYATGAATAVEPDTGTAGGLVGYNQGSVARSYATGTVAGTGDVGGLVGLNSDTNGSVDASYRDTGSTGQSGNGAGTGLTTAEMQGVEAQSTMSGLDFADVWAAVDAGTDADVSTDDYPVLQALDRATQLEARA